MALNTYHDTVGAERIDAALGAVNDFGRVIACVMIPTSVVATPCPHLHNLVTKRSSMRGPIRANPEFGQASFLERQKNMQTWTKEGSIRSLIHETMGIERAAEGLIGIVEGKKHRKSAVEILKRILSSFFVSVFALTKGKGPRLQNATVLEFVHSYFNLYLSFRFYRIIVHSCVSSFLTIHLGGALLYIFLQE